MIRDEEYEKIIENISILAEPMRVKILLEIASKKELRGKDILESFSITQPTLSHHLNLLTASGLVDMRKEGRCIWYSINQKSMSEIKEIIVSISDSKGIRKSSSTSDYKPVTRKAEIKKSSTMSKTVDASGLKKESSVPKPKQTIEVPDIEELKKNKKKKKDKDSKSDKKKKSKKKKK